MTLTSTSPDPSSTSLPAAPPHFRGEWLTASDPGYDLRRSHFNQRFDRRPAVVARCLGVQDVRAALASAREHGWEVAVRGGGRSPGGYSTIEGGMLIDLSLMNDVHVDPERRTARVGPGASQGDVLRETVPYGLAPVTGALSHIGFVGVAIMSGTGHLSPRHGYSCDGLLSAQIVLADGEVVTASATTNPDLFWAVRGAGDNFGVVVSVETQLHAVPESVVLGMWSWPCDDLPRLMRQHREYELQASPDVFMMAGFSAGKVSGELTFDLLLAHMGDAEAAARDVATIDAYHSSPTQRSVSEVDWIELHHAPEGSYPSSRQYWAATDLKEMDDISLDAIAAEAPHLAEVARGGNELVLGYYVYRGAMLRQVSSPPAAMSRRRGSELIMIAMTDDPAQDAECEAWADGVASRFRQAGLVHPGAMPNYTTRVDMRETWGTDYDRLAALKAIYDPGNLFRHNANIAPAATEGNTP